MLFLEFSWQHSTSSALSSTSTTCTKKNITSLDLLTYFCSGFQVNCIWSCPLFSLVMVYNFRADHLHISCVLIPNRWQFSTNEEITFLDSSMGNSDILSFGPHSFNSCLYLDQKWRHSSQSKIIKMSGWLPGSWTPFCSETCHCCTHWNLS